MNDSKILVMKAARMGDLARWVSWYFKPNSVWLDMWRCYWLVRDVNARSHARDIASLEDAELIEIDVLYRSYVALQTLIKEQERKSK